MLVLALKTNNNSKGFPDDSRVKQKRLIVRAALAKNLRALLDKREWSQTALKEKSGVSQRHISNVLNQAQSPSIEIVDALASAFNLPGWVLISADIPIDLLDTQRLPQLLIHYLDSSDKGRGYLDAAAEREAHHNKEQTKVLRFQKPFSA